MLRVGACGSAVGAVCASTIDPVGGCGPVGSCIESTIDPVSGMPTQWLAWS